jgi:hypothetical protein
MQLLPRRPFHLLVTFETCKIARFFSALILPSFLQVRLSCGASASRSGFCHSSHQEALFADYKLVSVTLFAQSLPRNHCLSFINETLFSTSLLCHRSASTGLEILAVDQADEHCNNHTFLPNPRTYHHIHCRFQHLHPIFVASQAERLSNKHLSSSSRNAFTNHQHHRPGGAWPVISHIRSHMDRADDGHRA